MRDNSRPVTSSQDGPHRNLPAVLDRHQRRRWDRPIAAHNRTAFESVRDWVRTRQRPLILDSGCGTARSSVLLAQRFPDCDVVAIDKSEARLGKAHRRFSTPENLFLVRADCADFWRLARQEGWRLTAHYLLYPNPWPKPAHLQRRWHGHPVFPDLLALGGRLEVRSNWLIYLQEMALALNHVAAIESTIEAVDGEPLTDFEEKYRSSGQSLFRLAADLQD
jgi:tRNA (guanine-N7-)-methyltransferase